MKPNSQFLIKALLAMATSFVGMEVAQAAAPRLLPFQGRLTDASGTPVADGAKVVQFKIYDAPTGGTAVWNGEVQKLTVNGGLVSTLLGSKADLADADFNKALYLEITIDANSDSQITAADPPLLPRQSILPTVYAVEAREARALKAGDGQTYDWSALFGAQSPVSGKIDAARLAPGSITSSQIQADTITGTQIGPASVDSSELKDSAVTSAKILDGTIQPADISAGYGLVPTGTVIAFAGATPPSGWLLCDGTAVSRSTYSVLFGVLGGGVSGVGHGIGNGTSTFNLPDYRGYFLRGVDGAAGRDPDKTTRGDMANGGATGNAVGSVQVDEYAAHSHTKTKSTASSSFNGDNAVSNGSSNGTVSTNPSGGNETRPKNAYVNYIIKF